MNVTSYPDAVDPSLVGTYSAVANAGGGYVWDDVLEYRVWCHPERGSADLEDGSDYYYPFATYAEALAFSRCTQGAEAPLALVRQQEYIAEDNPGEYRHVKEERITEWSVDFLRRPHARRIQFLTFWHRMHLPIGWIFFGGWRVVSAHRGFERNGDVTTVIFSRIR